MTYPCHVVKGRILSVSGVEKAPQLRSRIAQRLNVRERFSEAGITGGGFPFAKIHYKGERLTRSTV